MAIEPDDILQLNPHIEEPELISIDDFLYLVESYRTRKSELENSRKLLIQKIIKCSNVDALLWETYWRHGDVFQSREIADLLGITTQQLRERINGAIVSFACQKCGEKFNTKVKSRSKLQELQQRRRKKESYWAHLCEMCEEAKKAESERQSEESKKYWQAAKERQTLLSNMPYKEYLQTTEWQDIRKHKLRKAHYKCELCNSASLLHVHHKTYENRGNERDSDLIVLCESCHAKFHNKLAKEETA